MLTKIFNEKVSAVILLILGLTTLYGAVIIETLVIKLIAILLGTIISIVNALKLYLAFTAKSKEDKDPVYDRFSASFILTGAAITVGLILTAFTWKAPNDNLLHIIGCSIPEPEPMPITIEIEPPISVQKKKKKKMEKIIVPPPPPEDALVEIVEVDDNVELKEEEVIVASAVIDIADVLNGIPQPSETIGLGDDEVVKIIEEEFDEPEIVVDEPPMAPLPWASVMPSFKGGEKALLGFVKKNLVYPSIALENGIEGYTIVNFVVNEDGSISDIEIIQDPGGRCGQELKRIVSLMPNWIPGQQGDKNVKIRYTLPVKFEIGN